MKTAILTASLVVTVLAGALSANAADRKKVPLDGHKIFQEIGRASSSH